MANNARIMDFQTVEDWSANELDKTEYGRMPWHDVAMGLVGDGTSSNGTSTSETRVSIGCAWRPELVQMAHLLTKTLSLFKDQSIQ